MNSYSPIQREIWFSSVEVAEAAARDFQSRGYRRRTRGLAPGDVLVAPTTEGFALLWVPRDPAPSASGCLPFLPSPGGRGGLGEGRAWDQPRGAGGEGPGEVALAKLGASLGV
jgi:hypothetical protein